MAPSTVTLPLILAGLVGCTSGESLDGAGPLDDLTRHCGQEGERRCRAVRDPSGFGFLPHLCTQDGTWQALEPCDYYQPICRLGACVSRTPEPPPAEPSTRPCGWMSVVQIQAGRLEFDLAEAQPRWWRAPCAHASGGPEWIGRLWVPSAATVTARVVEANFAPILILRADCTETGPDDACEASGDDGRLPEVQRHVEPGSWTLIVDSPSPAEAGQGILEVIVEPDEIPPGRCDLIPQAGPAGGVFAFDTRGAEDSWQRTCGAEAVGPDWTLELTLQRSARVSFEITEADFDPVLNLIAGGCDDDENQEAFCDDGVFSGGLPRVELGLGAGAYYVVVDGMSPADAGQGLLRVEVSDAR